MIQPIVITDKKRKGRGFSLKELKEAELHIDKAKKLGIIVDKRRKTAYDENIEKLKDLLESKGKEEKIEEKVKEKEEKVERKKEVPKRKPKKEEIALTEVRGIGKKRSETLEEAGITSANDLVSLSVEEVMEKAGLSEKMASKLKKNAEELF